MPTNSTNFGLQKPLVNNSTDQDLWGGYLNGNIDKDDTLLLTGMVNRTVPETASFSVTGRTTGTITTGNLKNMFLCDCTGGPIVASLPAASSVDNGFVVTFKKMDASANALTITPAGSDTVELVATLAVTAQFDSFVLVSDGAANWNVSCYKHGVAPKNLSFNIQEFNTPGAISYTPTAGVIGAFVRLAGGGGGGAGSTAAGSACSSSGGAGGYLEIYLTATQITAALSGGSIAGIIGAAGAGGAAGGNNGTAGGTTSLGSLASCTGGQPGTYGTATQQGGAGGAPTVTSGIGEPLAKNGQSGGSGANLNLGVTGAGGSCSPVGEGGPFNTNGAASANGFSATGFGSGGSGAVSGGNNDGVARTGGNGGTGYIEITEVIFA